MRASLIDPYTLFASASLSFTQITTYLGTTAAVTLTSVADGDLAIFALGVTSPPAPPSTPSGWTSYGVSGAEPLVKIVGKVISGDTTLPTSTNRGQACGVLFRPSKAITSVTAVDFGGQTTAVQPSQRTVTPSGSSPIIILAGAWGLNGATSFSTASPAFDGTNTRASGTPDLSFGWKLYNGSTSAHNIRPNDSGSYNAFCTGYIRVA